MSARLDHRELYRLPWSLPDNSISWLEPTAACNLACLGCYRTNDPKAHKPQRSGSWPRFIQASTPLSGGGRAQRDSHHKVITNISLADPAKAYGHMPASFSPGAGPAYPVLGCPDNASRRLSGPGVS